MLPYGSKVSPLKPTRGAHSSSCSPIDSKFCTRCLLSCVNEYTPFIVNLNSKLYFKNVSPWVCPGERIESVTFFFTSLLWREKYKRWKNVTIYVVFHFFFSLFLYKKISIYDFLITFSRPAGNSRVSSLVRGIYLSLAPRLHLLEICTVLIRANLTVLTLNGANESAQRPIRDSWRWLFSSLCKVHA